MRIPICTLKTFFVLISIVFIVSFANNCFAKKSKIDTLIYKYKEVDTPPAYPGGEQALKKYVLDSIVLPYFPLYYYSDANVRVDFIVEKDGSISNIKLSINSDHILAPQIVKLLKDSPQWNPGCIDKQAKRVKYRWRINFPVEFLNERSAKEKIYVAVDEEPIFPGGKNVCNQFIRNNLKVPSDYIFTDGYTSIVTNFIVEKDGRLSEVKVISEISEEFENEIIRVIGLMPKWIPGKLEGNIVRLIYTYEIILSKDQYNKEFRKDCDNSVAPQFSGDGEDVERYLANNLKYPHLAIERKVKGVVEVKFVVESDGTISDIEIVKGIGSGCDQEVKRLLMLMPKWIPGFCDGKPVKSVVYHKVRFDIK